MPKGHAVVDGSNIATEGRNTPSLSQLDEAVTEFIERHDFEHVTVIVDASFEHRVEPHEVKAAQEAIEGREIITPPAGVIGRGDAFILEVADRANAVVLSNDSFQEFHGTYDWLFDDGRLIGGKPIPGVGWVFVTRSPVRGPISRRAVREANAVEPPPANPKVGDTRRVRKATKKTPSKRAAAEKPTPRVSKKTAKSDGPKASRGRKQPAGANTKSVMKSFRRDYPEGSTVAVLVESFSSHGAYGSVDGVSVYIPLRLLGDPAPRRARDVIEIGETRDFIVHAFDEKRMSIDVGTLPFAEGDATTDSADETKRPTRRGATKKTTKKAVAKKATPAKKTVKKKAVAKKATPAQETAARKTPARKAPAKKKTTAKKAAPAKKTTAASKAAPAKKATTKKAPAKRASAKKKTAAVKPTAKKASARKATKKKTTTRKAASGLR